MAWRTWWDFNTTDYVDQSTDALVFAPTDITQLDSDSSKLGAGAIYTNVSTHSALTIAQSSLDLTIGLGQNWGLSFWVNVSTSDYLAVNSSNLILGVDSQWWCVMRDYPGDTDNHCIALNRMVNGDSDTEITESSDWTTTDDDISIYIYSIYQNISLDTWNYVEMHATTDGGFGFAVYDSDGWSSNYNIGVSAENYLPPHSTGHDFFIGAGGYLYIGGSLLAYNHTPNVKIDNLIVFDYDSNENSYPYYNSNAGLEPGSDGLVAYFRSISDNLGITDAMTTAVGKVVRLTDNLGIQDAITLAVGKVVSLADNMGIADAVTTVVDKIVELADSLGITDTLTKVGTFFRTLSNNLGVTDTLSKVGTFFRTLSNNLSLSDVLTSTVGLIVLISDNLGITDAYAQVATYIRTHTESVSITDAVTNVQEYFRSVSESLGVTDVFSKVGTFIKNITDGVGILDSIKNNITIVQSFVLKVSRITLSKLFRSTVTQEFTAESTITDSITTKEIILNSPIDLELI